MQLDVSDTRRLDIVKDIFLFSCFTGLRFNDVINLDADKVHQTQSGYYEVTFKQQKTNDYASLPLIRPALEIYRKYDQDFRKITGKAFPSYSNQKFNAYLKEIADLSKINFDRPLTHHVARHTFATTVCIENDIPIEIVSKWLGHKKLQTTNVYAKLQNPLLARHGRDLIDKFKISIDEKG
jgi:site-specific recombinase XerD